MPERDARSSALPAGHPMATAVRWSVLAGYVAAVYAVVVAGLGALFWPSGHAAVPLSFLAAAISAAGARPVLRRVDRFVHRVLLHQTVDPYSALVTVAARLPAAGSVQQVLPSLARVLAEAVGARSASVWLLTDGRLLPAAVWPAAAPELVPVADLVELRAVPGIDDAVPILDGEVPRGALAIGKSGPGSVTVEDDRLLRDTATSAGLLLRTVHRNDELQGKLREAEKLELELRASEERLIEARDLERRRVVGEITAVTTDSLAVIRTELGHLDTAIGAEPDAADRVLSRLRPALDQLIERFRAVVRGVYPGVLRDEGPRTALEELAGDLPRPVLITGQLGGRVDWELESGIYYAAAAAMQLLARSRSDHPLRVHLGHESGRVTVRVDDTAPTATASAELHTALANDMDRLAALGGGLDFEDSAHRIAVLAWLPSGVTPDVVAPPAHPPDAADQSTADSPVVESAPGGHRLGGHEIPSGPLLARVRALVGAACEHYLDGPCGSTLLEIAGRLDEPLRVVLVGRVKSGKSTLLNALVGQEIAATDAADCTRLPIWYRHGASCRLTLYPREGAARSLEFAGTGPAGSVSLGELAPADVERLVVDWPSTALKTMTLIDSPGLDSPNSDVSQRTRALLAAGEGGIPTADAAVYLLRRLEPADIALLAGLSGAGGDGNPVSAVGVISRADEFRGCGADALTAAGDLVNAHRSDPALRRLCQAVVPVSGLLAAAAPTLREPDFLALHHIAALPDPDRGRLLRSADDFATASTPVDPAPVDRSALLHRLGLFGVRLAVDLIRQGTAPSAADLSAALLRHSGLDRLRDLLGSRLAARADVLKARSALHAMDTVLAAVPATDPHRDELRYQLEQLRAGAHELAEIDFLDRLRDGIPRLSITDSSAAERLLGGHGPDPRTRLGLPPDATPSAVHDAATRELTHWQQLAENPVAPRDIRDLARATIRTCEALLQPLRVSDLG